MLHNIKALCALRGISLREMCRIAGLCYVNVFKWDAHSPSVDKLVRIAEVLDCTLDEIVFGIKPKEPKEE